MSPIYEKKKERGSAKYEKGMKELYYEKGGTKESYPKKVLLRLKLGRRNLTRDREMNGRIIILEKN